jgi:steroid 5-alpha reductase family enzyme
VGGLALLALAWPLLALLGFDLTWLTGLVRWIDRLWGLLPGWFKVLMGPAIGGLRTLLTSLRRRWRSGRHKKAGTQSPNQTTGGK